MSMSADHVVLPGSFYEKMQLSGGLRGPGESEPTNCLLSAVVPMFPPLLEKEANTFPHA